jgi:hypothetical protein
MPRINIDLDFLTHPKIVSLHPLAELLHVRALIYCARHLTDGFVPEGAIPLLTYDYSCIFDLQNYVGQKEINNLERSLGYSEELLTAGMWEESDGGWMIHDYLDYQLSRKEVESHRKKRAEASVNNGKLGGRPAKPKHNLEHNLEHNLDVTQKNPTNTNTNTNTNTKEEDKSIASTIKISSRAVTDEVWIQQLKANELYQGIDIDLQLKKAQSWLQTNQPRRAFTRKYFGNWLTRALSDKPMDVATLGKPCQTRVKQGLESVPCNKPAVEMIGTRPVCKDHRPIKVAL